MTRSINQTQNTSKQQENLLLSAVTTNQNDDLQWTVLCDILPKAKSNEPSQCELNKGEGRVPS